MTVITFKGYRVLKLFYERKDQESKDEIKVSPKITYNSKINKDKKSANVLLGVQINRDTPFELEVKMEGSFVYNIQEDEKKEGFKDFLNTNAVAIMYPYLRNLISNLTGMSNEFPQLILPTINVTKLINKD